MRLNREIDTEYFREGRSIQRKYRKVLRQAIQCYKEHCYVGPETDTEAIAFYALLQARAGRWQSPYVTRFFEDAAAKYHSSGLEA